MTCMIYGLLIKYRTPVWFIVMYSWNLQKIVIYQFMETSSQQTTLEVCQSPSFSKDLLIINQIIGMHIDM